MSAPVPPPPMPGARTDLRSAIPITGGIQVQQAKTTDWGHGKNDGGCHCNGGNCYCDEECFSCIDDEATNKFCIHLDPDVDQNIEIELIKIRKWIRFLATLALIAGSVELGVGTFQITYPFVIYISFQCIYPFLIRCRYVMSLCHAMILDVQVRTRMA